MILWLKGVYLLLIIPDAYDLILEELIFYYNEIESINS